MAVKGLTLAFKSEFSCCAPLSLPACDWEENKYTHVYHSYPENPVMNTPLLDAVNTLIQCNVRQENCASVHCATGGVTLMRQKS